MKDEQLPNDRIVLFGHDSAAIWKLTKRPGGISRFTNESRRIASGVLFDVSGLPLDVIPSVL